MPLIRRGKPTAPPDSPPQQAGLDHLTNDLSDPSAQTRRSAARQLAAHGAAAVAPLAAALARESDPGVRESLFTALIAIGGDEAADALTGLLRAEDPGLRSGAVDALQTMAVAPQHLAPCLDDDDSDVRIQAVEAVRGLPPADATRLLCARLEKEDHPNVVAVALDVLGEVGTAACLPTVEAVAARFADDPFVPYAAAVVAERLGEADTADDQ